jgi:hypothetical protein
MKLNFSSIIIFSFLLALFAISCEKDDDITVEDPPEATIDTLMTADGIEFVRTPESNFDNLPDWPYAYQYVEIDGLRQAYAEAGRRMERWCYCYTANPVGPTSTAK